jgi:hypothetical protein
MLTSAFSLGLQCHHWKRLSKHWWCPFAVIAGAILVALCRVYDVLGRLVAQAHKGTMQSLLMSLVRVGWGCAGG